MREKQKLLISFSGGRTSAYMTWWHMNEWPDRHEWEMKVAFANTGKEDDKTLKFVDECDKRWGLNLIWVEAEVNSEFGKGTAAKVVNFETASRNGEPFEAMIKKYGIPNVSAPHCTRELKSRPIHWFIKNMEGWEEYFTAIGIRADEFDRMNPKRKELRYLYPLVTNNITKRDIAIFWEKQSFDLGLKNYEGNCDLCWKKSTPKLQRLCREKPSRIKWWEEMENKYGNYIPETRKHNNKIQLPNRFYRDRKSINDIKALPKERFTQTDMFEFGCAESCEPF